MSIAGWSIFCFEGAGDCATQFSIWSHGFLGSRHWEGSKCKWQNVGVIFRLFSSISLIWWAIAHHALGGEGKLFNPKLVFRFQTESFHVNKFDGCWFGYKSEPVDKNNVVVIDLKLFVLCQCNIFLCCLEFRSTRVYVRILFPVCHPAEQSKSSRQVPLLGQVSKSTSGLV